MKGSYIVNKVFKVLSVALVLAVILIFSVTGIVLAHNGNGPGDGTGCYADCPDDCSDCHNCIPEPPEYLHGGPGPHPPQD